MYVLCNAQRCNGRAGLTTIWKDREIKLVTVPLDPSRFSKKIPSSPDHSVKMGETGVACFF